MNKTEIKKAIDAIGLQITFVQTGDRRFVRGFMVDDGVTIARMVIVDGEYSHIKWYLKPEGEIHQCDFARFSWEQYLKTGQVLTQETWEKALINANAMVQADYQKKKEWRQANPKFKNKNRRRQLTYKNVRQYLMDLLIYEALGD